MTMIFKDGYLSEEDFDRVKYEDSLEFCIALQERLAVDSDNQYKIYQITENGESFFALKKEPDSERYLNIEGNLSFRGDSQLYKFNKRDIDLSKLQEYREILSDFYQLEFEKLVFDKNKKEYKLKYFSNYSTNQAGYSREDIIKVYDGDNKIGYLKLIYRKKEDHDELSPSTSLKFLIEKDIYGVDRHTNENEILKKISSVTGKVFKSISESDDYIENNFQHIVDEKYNIGTIFYSKIENENDSEDIGKYRGNGLGKIMYFEAARILNVKGISFRASTNQTELAKNLWKSLQKNLPNHIGTIHYKGDNFLTLNANQDESLIYEDGKLKINSIEEKIKKLNEQKYLTKKISRNQIM